MPPRTQLTPLQIEAIKKEITELEAELQTLLNQVSMKEQEIYTVASNNLGKHLTLNAAVPNEVGCAESVSKVLSLAGISDGPQGIAGTAALDAWLAASPLFNRVDSPQEGAIIVNATGSGNGSIEGHTGIFGAFGKQFAGDWGIMSNDSPTGLFLERWSYSRWLQYYHIAGGLNVHIYRAA